MQLPAHSQSFPRTAGNRRTRSPYHSLRHTPEPLKSLLRPIWTAIDGGVQAGAERAAGSFPSRATDVPIRPMTRAEFDGLAARHPYYQGRDGYLGAAAWVPHETEGVPMVWPEVFAALGDEYDRRYGLDGSHLAALARNSFESARNNPNAQTRKWDLPERAFEADEHDNPVVAGRLRRHDSVAPRCNRRPGVMARARRQRRSSAASQRSINAHSPLGRLLGWPGARTETRATTGAAGARLQINGRASGTWTYERR